MFICFVEEASYQLWPAALLETWRSDVAALVLTDVTYFM